MSQSIIKVLWNDSSPRCSGEIIETIEDTTYNDSNISDNDIYNSDNGSDSDKDSDTEPETPFEKIGIILMQYEDIICEKNLDSMIEFGISNIETHVFCFEVISKLIKKYKEKLPENSLNILIKQVIDSSNKYIKQVKQYALEEKLNIERENEKFNTNINYYEKIIDEYFDVLKEDSIVIYLKNISNISNMY
tara:strand:- start:61 stop:633 length:573 start_codon:yes stop_codon:yes gene_type:complete